MPQKFFIDVSVNNTELIQLRKDMESLGAVKGALGGKGFAEGIRKDLAAVQKDFENFAKGIQQSAGVAGGSVAKAAAARAVRPAGVDPFAKTADLSKGVAGQVTRDAGNVTKAVSRQSAAIANLGNTSAQANQQIARSTSGTTQAVGRVATAAGASTSELGRFQAAQTANIRAGVPLSASLKGLSTQLGTVQVASTKSATSLLQMQFTMRSLGTEVLLVAAKLSLWTAAAVGIGAVVGLFSSVAGAVRDVDLALINLQRVTDNFDRNDAIKSFRSDFRELRVDTEDVTTAAFEMAKAFGDANESLAATRTVLLATKVAEVEVGAASRRLVQVSNAYALSGFQLTDVLDKLNEQQNTLGVTIPKTLEAVARASSVTRAAGGSLDDLVGRTAVGVRFSGFEPSTVARAQARVAQNLLAEKGRARIETALVGTGINLIDEDGTKRSLDAVLNDVGKDFSQFGADQQQAIAEGFAGGRKGNLSTILLTILKNFDRVQTQSQISANAAGSAYEELGDVFGSAQENIKAISAELAVFATNVNESGFVQVFGGTLVILREVLSVLNDLGGLVNSIPLAEFLLPLTLLGGLTSVKAGPLAGIGAALRPGFGGIAGIRASDRESATKATEVGASQGLTALGSSATKAVGPIDRLAKAITEATRVTTQRTQGDANAARAANELAAAERQAGAAAFERLSSGRVRAKTGLTGTNVAGGAVPLPVPLRAGGVDVAAGADILATQAKFVGPNIEVDTSQILSLQERGRFSDGMRAITESTATAGRSGNSLARTFATMSEAAKLEATTSNEASQAAKQFAASLKAGEVSLRTFAAESARTSSQFLFSANRKRVDSPLGLRVTTRTDRPPIVGSNVADAQAGGTLAGTVAGQELLATAKLLNSGLLSAVAPLNSFRLRMAVAADATAEYGVEAARRAAQFRDGGNLSPRDLQVVSGNTTQGLTPRLRGAQVDAARGQLEVARLSSAVAASQGALLTSTGINTTAVAASTSAITKQAAASTLAGRAQQRTTAAVTRTVAALSAFAASLGRTAARVGTGLGQAVKGGGGVIGASIAASFIGERLQNERPDRPDPVAGALSGAGGGASLGFLVGGLPGAGIGAAAGALTGFVSTLNEVSEEIKNLGLEDELSKLDLSTATLRGTGAATSGIVTRIDSATINAVDVISGYKKTLDGINKAVSAGEGEIFDQLIAPDLPEVGEVDLERTREQLRETDDDLSDIRFLARQDDVTAAIESALESERKLLLAFSGQGKLTSENRRNLLGQSIADIDRLLAEVGRIDPNTQAIEAEATKLLTVAPERILFEKFGGGNDVLKNLLSENENDQKKGAAALAQVLAEGQAVQLLFKDKAQQIASDVGIPLEEAFEAAEVAAAEGLNLAKDRIEAISAAVAGGQIGAGAARKQIRTEILPQIVEGLAGGEEDIKQALELIDAVVQESQASIDRIAQRVQIGQISESQGRRLTINEVFSQLNVAPAGSDAQLQALASLQEVVQQRADDRLQAIDDEAEAALRLATSEEEEARINAEAAAAKDGLAALFNDAANGSNEALKELGLASVSVRLASLKSQRANLNEIRKTSDLKAAKQRAIVAEAQNAFDLALSLGIDSPGLEAALIAAKQALGAAVTASQGATGQIGEINEDIKEAGDALDVELGEGAESAEQGASNLRGATDSADDLKDKERELISARFALLKALAGNDTVKAARLELQEAQAILATGGNTQAEQLKLRADVINAQEQLRESIFQSRLEDIDFALETERITEATALAKLKSLLPTVKDNKARKRELLRRIFQLSQDTGDKQFGLPEIPLPTGFQLGNAIAGGLGASSAQAAAQQRKTAVAGASQGPQIQNNNSITIKVSNKDDLRKVRQIVEDATGLTVQQGRNIGFNPRLV